MARARNIKPGFFKNERLADCDPLARMLYAGLWCEADREGRLEDRPRRLKAEYLPYDDCDADALLAQLEKAGFIVRYVVDGTGFIAIPAFNKHQNPHMREPASSIPAPGQHSASTVQAPDTTSSGPADSPSLIPDSLIHGASPPSVEAPPAWPAPEARRDASLGRRLPADWEPTETERAWAAKERPDLDLVKEADKFRDHWSAKAGKDGRKTDWAATWRNWIRNAGLFRGGAAQPIQRRRSELL